jgi:hypothetical protein
MVRSTRVELVVGISARQPLELVRLPFRHDRALVPAGRLERPTFRMSRGCSAVELRREMAPGQGFKPRFAASGAAVLSLDDPGMLAPPGGYDPPAPAFEARRSIHLS